MGRIGMTDYKTWGEMSDAEQGELLLAHHRGEVIEMFTSCGWANDSPDWDNDALYRVKPKTATFEVDMCASPHRTNGPVSMLYGPIDGATKGHMTATYVNNKPVKIEWEAV